MVRNEHSAGLVKRGSSYSGKATWFMPSSPSEGGNVGACGPKMSDSSMVVALNHAQYGNMDKKSKYCGKKIKITGPHGTAYAKIEDACPGCGHGDLDLTPAVFKKVVGNMNIGVGKIKWTIE
jgi:expansin (peptidoglycan-binding protein)